MQFDDKTLRLLQNFSEINKSIIFVPGNIITTVHVNKSILARAPIDFEIEREFAVHDLSRLIGVVRLFDKPSVSFKSKGDHGEVLVLSEGRKRIEYTLTPKDILVPAPRNIKDFNAEIKFRLTHDMLRQIKDAASALGHKEIALTGHNNELLIQTVSEMSSDVFSLQVGETPYNDFSLVMRIENLKFLPGDYDVSASFKCISKFTSEEVQYLVAIESKVSKLPKDLVAA